MKHPRSNPYGHLSVGLKVHLSLNDSGGNAKDRSGNQNTGILYQWNGNWNSGGLIKGCLEYGTDGNDYMDVGGFSTYTAGVYTIAWWMRPTNVGTYTCQTGAVNGWSNAFLFHLSSSNGFYCGVNTTHRYNGSNKFYNNTWHHVLFQYNNGTARLFIDGVQFGTTGTSWNGGNSWGGLRVGDPTGGFGDWLGRLDEFYFWDRYLGDQEIKFLYNMR